MLCGLMQMDTAGCSAIMVTLLCSQNWDEHVTPLNTVTQYDNLTEVKVAVINIKQGYPGLTKYYV